MNKNDPFDAHGIEHLSPSSLNTYLDDKAMWIMRYLFGYKNGGGPAMWRGNAVDGGIGAYFGFEDKLYSTSECVDLVKLYYETDKKRCRADFPKQSIDENKYIEEEDRLERYFKTAVNFYDDIGVPLDYQKKIELQLPDIPVPILGYIDLLYEDSIRDIKTTARSPSKVSDAHARQVSVYAKAENRIPLLDYVVVTAKEEKVVTHEIKDVERNIKTVEQIAYSIMQFLSYSNDKYELANSCYPNLDDWKWGEDEINFAKQIWSI